MSLEFFEKSPVNDTQKMVKVLLSFLDDINSDPKDKMQFIDKKSDKYGKYFKRIMDIYNDYRDNSYKIQEINKLKSKARYSKLDNDEMEYIFEVCTKCVSKLKKEKGVVYHKNDKPEDTFKFELH